MPAQLRVIEPSILNRSVTPGAPGRPSNASLRPREYLTEAEIEQLMKAARDGRYGRRDATLILIAFRHGLRATEIADLEWSQVELGRAASLHVRRAKNGKPGVHPIRGDELRALRELRRQFPDSAFVFTTERGTPFTTAGINRQIKRIGKRAGLAFPVMFTCCGTPAATPWRMRSTIRAKSKTGWGTNRFSTQCATPN